jgi:Thioredoxin-like/Domain of unknown function (DUF4369)
LTFLVVIQRRPTNQKSGVIVRKQHLFQVHTWRRDAGLAFVALALLAFGCGGKADDAYLIEGQLQGVAGKKVVLQRVEGLERFGVDSLEADQAGKFTFTGKAGPNDLYQVLLPTQQAVALVPHNHLVLLSGNAANLAQVQVEGGPVNAILHPFRIRQSQLYSVYMRNARTLSSINREQALETWRKAEAETDISLMAYLDYLRNFSDTVSVPLLKGIAGLSLKIDDNHYRFGVLLQRMERELPGHAITRAMRATFDKDLAKFNAYLVDDFESDNSLGEKVHFHQFHGKVVLFYVWASYCEYSRRENKRLAALWRSKAWPDFEIVDYAVDEDLNAWRKALAEDSLPWSQHLISPSGLRCFPVDELGIRTIPFTYLIDRKGILRSKKLFSPDLEQDLDSLIARY